MKPTRCLRIFLNPEPQAATVSLSEAAHQTLILFLVIHDLMPGMASSNFLYKALKMST